LSVIFFLLCGAYAAFFKPANWQNLTLVPKVEGGISNFSSLVRKNGFGIGISIYVIAVATFAFVALVSAHQGLAILMALPIAFCGLAIHIYWLWTVIQSRR